VQATSTSLMDDTLSPKGIFLKKFRPIFPFLLYIAGYEEVRLMLIRVFSLTILLVLSGVALAQQPAPPKTQLKVGDAAPDFSLTDTNGKPVRLSDFRGQKNVVLAFYVLAFTGG